MVRPTACKFGLGKGCRIEGARWFPNPKGRNKRHWVKEDLRTAGDR